MTFSEKDKVSTKIIRQHKQYGTKKFLKRVPSKGMVVRWIKTIMRTIDSLTLPELLQDALVAAANGQYEPLTTLSTLARET